MRVAADGSNFFGAWAAGLAFGGHLRRGPSVRGVSTEVPTPGQSMEFTERLGLLLAPRVF
ncbi:hypothetical protein ACIBSV_46310 [Embleya sp. NPDC050154]|uniref:hypothetical protein n=1 Tax=Embleya sp. NPDC050154 TaxID=3363988 RepID=UPI0037B1AB50